MSDEQWPIPAIRLGDRHRKELGDIAGLGRSIADIGLLHPIVVNRNGTLIAGERRLKACTSLGWSHIPVTIVNLDNIVRGELAENAERKDFLPSEIDAIRRALEPEEKAAATIRKLSGRSVDSAGDTRDRIGAFAGVSGRTVDKIAAVVEAAEAEPERFGKLLSDMDRTGRVNGVYKRLRVAKQAEQIKAEPPPSGKTTNYSSSSLSRARTQKMVADEIGRSKGSINSADGEFTGFD